jgi:hypothetical protein
VRLPAGSGPQQLGLRPGQVEPIGPINNVKAFELGKICLDRTDPAWNEYGTPCGMRGQIMPSDKSDGPPDDRLIRLFDLAPHEKIIVYCECGWVTEYGRGALQRQHRIPSDTLVYDLQFRLRCKHCNRIDGFGITIFDARCLANSSLPRVERVIVPKG